MFDETIKTTLLRRIPHGLYVCGSVSAAADHHDAFTLTWLTQSSFEPPTVLIAVRRGTNGNALIRASKVFSINFLNRDQEELADHFRRYSEGARRLDGQRFHPGVTGSPILDDAAGAIECTVLHILEHGDHDVFLGEVIATEGTAEGEQLTLDQTGWTYGG